LSSRPRQGLAKGGPKEIPGVTFHVPRSARECEGMNPHIPKFLDDDFRGQNPWIEKFLISLESSSNVDI